MVRGIVKSPKQSSKDDAFQSSMKQVGGFVKENAFTIILAVAVIGTFVTWAVWKSATTFDEGGWSQVDKMKDPKALLTLAEKHKGEDIERMALKIAADRLFEEYQRDEAPFIGETPMLDKAEKICRELEEKYGNDEKYAGFIFGVRDSIKIIEQERADIKAKRFPRIERPEPAPEPVPDEASTPGSQGPGDTTNDQPSESSGNCPDCGTKLPVDSDECPNCRAPGKAAPSDSPSKK